MLKILKKIFFTKFRAKKLISSSKSISVYEGIYEKKNEPVIMKFQDKTKFASLENEAFLLYYLKGFGIPKIISFGKTGLFNILIEELLGLSINQLLGLKKINKQFKLKNISMVAIQALDRLEYIHSKDIIHRDIRPNNFLIGRIDPKNIYLIDFGFAGKYRSSRTGKHIKYKYIKIILGSLIYVSINGNKGYEQSRRDDLESLGYMLIDIMTNYLPWNNYKDLEVDGQISYSQNEKLVEIKSEVSPEILCKGLPEEFVQYIKYVKNLDFEQEPDYDYLRGLFTTILIKNQQNNDLNFFWIISNKKLKSIKYKTKIYERNNNFLKRRRSRKQRLYSQIKESLEKKKNLEISENQNLIHYQSENNKHNLILKDNNIVIEKNPIEDIKVDLSNCKNKKKLIFAKTLNNSQIKKDNNSEINYGNNLKLINKVPELNYETYIDKLKTLNKEKKVKYFENINGQSSLENKPKYNLIENNSRNKNIIKKNDFENNELLKKEDRKKLNSNNYNKKINQVDELPYKVKGFIKKDSINNNIFDNKQNQKKLKQIMRILNKKISHDIIYVSSINNSYEEIKTFNEYPTNKTNNDIKNKLYNKNSEINLEKDDTQIKNKSNSIKRESNNINIPNNINNIPLYQRYNYIKRKNKLNYSNNINMINIINHNNNYIINTKKNISDIN